MIRSTARYFIAAALVALSIPSSQLLAQTQAPAAPAENAAPAAPATQAAPSAPAPAPSTAPVWPKPNPANFTAASPTKQAVDDFLEANLGYDVNRIWQVQAILTTQDPDVSKVIVLLGDKTGKQKPQVLEFFVLPGGKYIVTGDQVISFGEHPFAETRAILQQKADGPYRGSPNKDFEIVEFADFQCPHCKEAQPNMDKLVTDYPNARIVFQYDPLTSIHPQAERAAEYGVCVNKMGGSSAFFQFAAAVFDGQDGLSTPDGATLTLNSAVTKAGLDPAKVSSCAATPEAKAVVDASVDLANSIGIGEVPMLVINGRHIPGNVPYDLLKQVIDYQLKRDGLSAK